MKNSLLLLLGLLLSVVFAGSSHNPRTGETNCFAFGCLFSQEDSENGNVKDIVGTPVFDSTVPDKPASNVNKEASAKERVNLALNVHPDKNGGSTKAIEANQALKNAKETLMSSIQSKIGINVGTPEKATPKFVVPASLKGIVDTEVFNEFVAAFIAFQISSKTELFELINLLNKWVDSFKNTPVNDLNVWLQYFATEDQNRAVVFAKEKLESQYEKLDREIKCAKTDAFTEQCSTRLLRVPMNIIRIRMEKLNGVSNATPNFNKDVFAKALFNGGTPEKATTKFVVPVSLIGIVDTEKFNEYVNAYSEVNSDALRKRLDAWIDYFDSYKVTPKDDLTIWFNSIANENQKSAALFAKAAIRAQFETLDRSDLNYRLVLNRMIKVDAKFPF